MQYLSPLQQFYLRGNTFFTFSATLLLIHDRQYFFRYFCYFTTYVRGNTSSTRVVKSREQFTTLLLLWEATLFSLFSLLYYFCKSQHFFHYFNYFTNSVRGYNFHYLTTFVRGNTIFTTLLVV